MTISRRNFTLLAAAFASGATSLSAKSISRFSTKNGLALKGFDTTAYFAKSAATEGSDSHSVTWQGAIWHFETAAEAAAFQATPDAFAPQFGGYCTRAMAIQREVPGDPTVWRIRNDKLYVFYAAKGGKLFDENPDDMIAKAQAHWDTLSKSTS